MFALLATGANAQTRCPGSSICYCYLSSGGAGLEIECSGSSYSPEQIRNQLDIYKQNGPITSLLIYSITQSKFSYVVDDFLAGNEIPQVSLNCAHSHSVTSGHLTFSAYAFADSTGKCGLTGNLTISDCNIRQFNTAILNNCDRLEKLHGFHRQPCR